MTLKKFLKKYIDAFADVYNNGVYLGCSDILDKKYKEWRVDKVFPAYSKSDLRCGIVAINIEPPKEKKPKRSANYNVDDLKKFVDAYKDLSYKSGIKISSDKVSIKEKKPCEYAVKSPITGDFHCTKWIFTECDCEYMQNISPVCFLCKK